MIDLDQCRAVFGQMLRNAQALEAILRAEGLTLPDSDTTLYAQTLQTISASTIQQTATLQEMQLALGLDRRQAERRSGQDRRGRP